MRALLPRRSAGGAIGVITRVALLESALPVKADPAAGVLTLTLALAEFWIERSSPVLALRLLNHLDSLDSVPSEVAMRAGALRVRAAIGAQSIVTTKRA